MSKLMEDINPLVQAAIDEVGPSVVAEFFIHTASVIHELYKEEIEGGSQVQATEGIGQQ